VIVAFQPASANEYAGTSQSVTLPLERMASGPPSGRKRFVSERPCDRPQPRRIIGHIGLFWGVNLLRPLDLPVTGSPIFGKLNDGRTNQDERRSIERKRRNERRTLNFGHDVQRLRRHGQTRFVAGSRSQKRGGRSRQGRRRCRRDCWRSRACRCGCRCGLRSATAVTAGERRSER
jgi:hypothetical protein